MGAIEHTIFLNLLRKTRIEAGLRQSDLAHRLGVPQSMISKYEVGERRVDVLELRDICESIGVSFPSFICELEELIKENKNEAKSKISPET